MQCARDECTNELNKGVKYCSQSCRSLVTNAAKKDTYVYRQRVAQARRLYEDGASTLEVSRTTKLHPRVLRNLFPGQSWTKEQQAEYTKIRNAMPDTYRKMNDNSIVNNTGYSYNG